MIELKKIKLGEITHKCRYEECKDDYGTFHTITYNQYPIAEIRVKPGWFDGKKIEECFKIYFNPDHPEDYCWINVEKKKRL